MCYAVRTVRTPAFIDTLLEIDTVRKTGIIDVMIKFGFGAIPSVHFATYIEITKLAEDLGFDSAWVPDQTLYRDPYAILAVLANVTEKINLGVGVTNPNTRHPAMAARAIASIDEMAPGRVALGIGAGNNKELLKPLGLEVEHAGAKCREMALIVRELLTGKAVDYRGHYFLASGIKMDFTSSPEIPIYIAGRGPAVLRAAGEVASGAIIGGLCGVTGINYALNQIESGTKKAGRDLGQLEIISWVTVNITNQREQALEDLKPIVAHLIGGAPQTVLDAIGMDPVLVKQIKATYLTEGILNAAKFVSPSCIDAFAIVGDRQECSRRIKELENAGVTQLVMLMPPGVVEQQKQFLRNFAEVVFPNFQ